MGYYVNYKYTIQKIMVYPQNRKEYISMPTRKIARRTWTNKRNHYLKANCNRVSVSTLLNNSAEAESYKETNSEKNGIRLSTLERNQPKPKIIRRKYKAGITTLTDGSMAVK